MNKQIINPKEIECSWCGKLFIRASRNIEFRKRLGKKDFYCSRSCASQYKMTLASAPDISKYAGSSWNELSPFRAHMKGIKCRSKRRNWKVAVTLYDLKEQWELQEGKCAYTGVIMDNPNSTSKYDGKKSLYKASVDRINPKLSYTKNNIQFVLTGINFAKNGFSDVEFRQFLSDIMHP